MASISTSISPTAQNQNRFDLDSIRILVLSVDHHILRFLENSETQKRLQLNCNSKLKIQKQEFFEFSEQTVLSNLYWGIENVESAIRAVTQEDRATYLRNAEKMLQIPALLEEYGSTGGISNRYLVCCAYFYLSLIRKLEGDEWQMTLHFLQAVLVSPRHVRREFAPELCEFLFLNRIVGGNEEMGGRGGIHSKSVVGFREDAIDDLTKQMARRYKDRMMYYRVVLYGETPRWLQRCADACTHELESSDSWYKNPASSKHSDSDEEVTTWPIFHDAGMIPRLDLQENTNEEDRLIVTEKKKAFLMVDGRCHDSESDEMYHSDTIGESKIIKCLQDMLKESQSDTSISIRSCIDSAEGSDFEEKIHDNDMLEKIRTMDANVLASEIGSRKLLGHGSISLLECVEMSPPEAPRFPVHEESYDLNTSYFFSSRSHGSENDLNLSFMDPNDTDLASFHSCCIDDGAMHQRSPSNSSRSFDYRLSKLGGPRKSAREKAEFSNSEKNPSEVSLYHGNDDHMEMLGRFEKAISNLCFSEGLRKCEDAGLEVSIVREIVNSKTGMKYGLLKEVILSQLLNVISTSKEDKIVRALIAILLVLISENHSIIEDIKRKNSYLRDLGNALKRNVHEAAVLIYLLNPSPTEIKDLELLSLLVEAACNSNSYMGPISLPLTPTAASIMMIEALVTKLDYATSNMHLEVISSPQVLSRLVNVARYKNLEEGASLAGILISCMRFDAKCRNYLAQAAPVATFLQLLRSNKRHAKFAALEFFHEILRIPRSSATSLLHQIRRVGNINIMHTLMACIQQDQTMHRLFAANLLLQLDMMEDSFGKSIFREEAIEALLESVASEESPDTQALSAFILSNLGGTYAWTGESYTVAWLLKKTGLTSMYHKNMIRNIDWSDQCLKDAGIDPCCSKVARSIIKIGNPVFHTLEKGLRSNTRSVSRDCLIAISWLGCEVAVMDPSCLGYSVRETFLNGIVHFLHPGSDLEEKLLACLCVYKYASGKSIQSLMNVSEAVRESLRRLSGITWMADELLKVADYFLPTESHVSCVHTQILEAGHNGIGATNALIFYKGQLYSGHSDGSIKVWDIKGQTTKLVWEFKEHKKAVTYFALYEPGDALLSGSADKTIKVWKTAKRKLNCVEVIEMKEPIQRIDTYGHTIFAITPSQGLKACDASRTVRVICRSKHVNCMAVAQGKIYLGCTDSSIQEVDATTDQTREIKGPTKGWWMQKRPINSILLYKDWLYSATDMVEGSRIKVHFKKIVTLDIRCNSCTDWRKNAGMEEAWWGPSLNRNGQTKNVLALSVSEDFMYLNCSSSPSIVQIWLRGKHQKVGRLSAGSRITSLLTANDIVLCGTETGLIKGWLPF